MNEQLSKGLEALMLLLIVSLQESQQNSQKSGETCENREAIFKMSKLCLGNDLKMLRQFENHEKM